MSTLYLIDASCYIFRAYYSVSEQMRDRDGEPANAVYGFGTFLCELLERRNPTHVAIAFDESLGSCFRHQLYPAYKAQRPPAPVDLKHQFERCRLLARALGIATLGSSTHEADDLIGSLGAQARREQFSLVFVSADKDLAQLVEHDDRLWDPPRRRWFDPTAVRTHFGVWPNQLADWLGLAGDAVDNIPGVPGIGSKTAARLLSAYGSLERIYDNLDGVEALPLRGATRVRRLLEQHREQAWLSRRLATIDCDAPVPRSPAQLVWQGADVVELEALGLPGLLTRRASRLTAALELGA